MPNKKSDTPSTDEPPFVETSPGVAHQLTPAIKGEHGAQVHLTGEARAAARGGLHGDITSNTLARDMAVAKGEAADGTTVDGSTPDGRLPADVVDGADKAVYSEPGKGVGKPDVPAV